MRPGRIALLVVAALLLQATPAGALTVPTNAVGFTLTPVGGTPGTAISVSGYCYGASEGSVYLEEPTYSDVAYPPGDSEHFFIDNGHFELTLTSPYGSSGPFPTDAEVRVYCGQLSLAKPFHGSDLPTSNAPKIFTSLGAGRCGPGGWPHGPEIPCPAHIKGFTSTGALAETNFYPPREESHGVSIAVGDVNNDGTLDVVTGSGPGVPGAIRLFSLTGEMLANPPHAVYDGFTGGVNVAIGDVTGDGKNDVVTGAGPGGGPHVLVLSHASECNCFETVGSFFAYDPAFGGGVNVATGGPATDGKREIVTGAGSGGGPNVRRFSASGSLLGSFFAYDPAFGGGVSVAAGSDPFNGLGRIVTGAGPGGGPHVRVFDDDGNRLNEFYAYNPAFSGGVSVALGRATRSLSTQIVTSPGAGGAPHLQIFNTDGTLYSSGFYAYWGVPAGVKVAVAP
jgi:hypothetical protein